MVINRVEAAGPGDALSPPDQPRHSILVEAGTLLASSLECDATLRHIVALAVPAMADICLIHTFTPGVGGGEVRRVAQSFQQEVDLTTDRSGPVRVGQLDAENPVAVALRTGRTRWIQDVQDRDLVAAAVDKHHLADLRAARPRSLICVPLAAHGRTLGTMMLVTSASQRRYESEDLDIAEALALRAAWALDCAQAHEASERARRRSEEALATSETSNRLKDTFLATLSHELRTPMAALLLWEKILRTAKDEATRARALDAIHDSALAQSKLVEDLLDISRCITGKLPIESRAVSINVVIAGAVEGALPMAAAKGIRLEAAVPRPLGCVMGDPARLRQVLANLLSNAINFTAPGGLVEVRGEQRGACVEIAVTDTGCGIAAELLPEVFEPFRQADVRPRGSQVGLGLGLAIVRQLVEVHGGTVRAESEGRGCGSRFTVSLPALSARETVVASPGAKGPRRAARERWERDAAPLKGLRILVLDDEPAVLEALALILRAAGAGVVTSRSAREALSALRRGCWDVVVSDIAMPGEDGYSFVRRLRALASGVTRRLPAVALTAHAGPQNELRAIEAGFDVHLPKPVEAHDLLCVIAGAVARAKPPIDPSARTSGGRALRARRET